MAGYYQGLLGAQAQLADLEHRRRATGLLDLQAQRAQAEMQREGQLAPLRFAQEQGKLAEFQAGRPLRQATQQEQLRGLQEKREEGALGMQEKRLKMLTTAKSLFTSVGDQQSLDQANRQFEQFTGQPSPYRARPFTPDFRDKVTQDLATIGERLKMQELQQGKAPPGYRPSATGLEAIPGGPADLKQQGVFNQDVAVVQSTSSDLDRLAQEANRLKSHPGLERATGYMSAVPFVGGAATIPGTDPANFKASLETLKSQVAFGVLQNMRNNSKTGGALGQVSDKEGQLLMANLAALDRAQDSDEFKAALQRIIDYTENAKDRLRGAFNLKYERGGRAQPQQPIAPRPSPGVVSPGPTAGGRVINFNDLP